MSNWSVRDGLGEFGWKNGKAVTNEHGAESFEFFPLVGLVDRRTGATPGAGHDPQATEEAWANWIDNATDPDTRTVIGKPPFFEPDPNVIY